MSLSRIIIAADGQQYSPIRVKILSKLFLLSDWACLQIQSSGVSWLQNAKSVSSANGARDLVLAGLALQIICFILFILVAGVWQYRVQSLPLWKQSEESGLPLGWTLSSLYSIGVLIGVRSVYRLIEYAQGDDGYLNSHEWPSYAFDTILMAIVMAIALYWYTVNLKPKEDQQSHQRMVSCDTAVELEQHGATDQREESAGRPAVHRVLWSWWKRIHFIVP